MTSLIRSPKLSTKSRLLSTELDLLLPIKNPLTIDQNGSCDDANKISAEQLYDLNRESITNVEKDYPIKQELKTIDFDNQKLLQKIEELKTEAKEKGYAEGYHEGIEKSQEQIQQKISKLNLLFESCSNRMSQLIEKEEDTIVELVFTAVIKMLGSALVTEKGVISVVKQVATGIIAGEKIIIRVSPDQFDLISKNRQIVGEGLNEESIQIVADDRIQLGGCIIDISNGSLDGRLEKQIDVLRDTLLEVRRNNSLA